MSDNERQPLIEKGIWIQEQNGVLTMGTLAQESSEKVVLPDKLADTIFALEDEMMDALYGKSAVAFDPHTIDVKLLLEKLAHSFGEKDVTIVSHCPYGCSFEGKWDELFDLFSEFIHHSIEYELKDVAHKSIHIYASVVDGNLCLVYRDSGDSVYEDRLKRCFDYIRNTLQGEVSIKSGSEGGGYLDIMIPRKHV